jgi:phosphinothricin acetyltransferase
MLVRPARAADLAEVGEIFGWYANTSVSTFEDQPRTAAFWLQHAAELASLELPFLVAESDGRVVGYTYAGPWRRKPAYQTTVEDSVFVAPDRTGLGIGRQLLAELLSACSAAGIRQVIAVIADSAGDASVALHRACGFTNAGRLTAVGFKHGRWIDTVLMQRSMP